MVKTRLMAVALFILVMAACTAPDRSAPAATGTVPPAEDEPITAVAAEVAEDAGTLTLAPTNTAPAPTNTVPPPTSTPEPSPAPSPTAVPTNTPQETRFLDLAESGDLAAAIYAAAVRHVYHVDFSFGEDGEISLVYIIAETDDGQTLEAPFSPAQAVPRELQQALAAELADELFEIIWVPAVSDVPVGGNGQIADGQGIYIILGNVLLQDDGSVHLPLHMVCGTLCLTGTTYVLQEVDGRWQVTGKTGLEVMG